MTRYTSTNPAFPLSVDLGPKFLDPPPPQPKGVWILVRAAGIAFVLGVVACGMFGSFGPFLPVFIVATLLGWIGGSK